MTKIFNLLTLALVLVANVAAEETTKAPEVAPQVEPVESVKASADNDDKVIADMSAEDQATFQLIDLPALSKIEKEHRKSDAKERCDSFEAGLRQMLRNQRFGISTKERDDLFESVSRVLAQKKLPFGNQMPSLRAIQECLPSERRTLKDTLREVEDKVEKKMDKLEKFVDKVEDKIEDKVDEVVDKVKKHEERQQKPEDVHHENHQEQHVESHFNGDDGDSRHIKRHSESHVEHHRTYDRQPIGQSESATVVGQAPVPVPVPRESNGKESELIKDLTRQLEDQRELGWQMEQIIQEDAATIDQLKERVAELEAILQQRQQSDQFASANDFRIDMMHQQAAAREAEMRNKLDAARNRLQVLEKVAKDNMDGDDYKKVITNAVEMAKRLHEKMKENKEDQRTACQKYYTVFTYPGKVRKGVIKVIAKMRPEAMLPYYGPEYYKVIEANAKFVAENGDKSTVGIARELKTCLSFKPIAQLHSEISVTRSGSAAAAQQLVQEQQHSHHSRHKSRQQKYFAKRQQQQQQMVQQQQSHNGQVTSSGYVATSTNGGPMQVQSWGYPAGAQVAAPMPQMMPVTNAAGQTVSFVQMGAPAQMQALPAMPPMPGFPNAYRTSMYGFNEV